MSAQATSADIIYDATALSQELCSDTKNANNILMLANTERRNMQCKYTYNKNVLLY